MLLSDNSEYKNILINALTIWGYKDQLSMAVGECGEFLTEVGREAQGRSSPEKMLDEVADVIIMMNQIGFYHGEDYLKERIKFKMNRVKEKLEKNLK